MSTRVWGIQGGRTGDAFTLFTEHDVVALGWESLADLRLLGPDQGSFREAVRAAYPVATAGAIPVIAGQLRRFVHELQIGDIVVFPARADWTYRIGEVTGDYAYAADANGVYPHRRSVKWLKTIRRDELPQTARFELGAAMGFFRVRRHVAEVLALIGRSDGGGEAAVPDGEDEQSDVATAGQIEEETRQFLLDRLRSTYAGHALEEFVADLLSAMGYRANATKKSGDHGVDVVAGKGPLGLDPPILKVQVKSGIGHVSEPDLVKLKGSIDQTQGERAVVVALGGFSPQATKWAATYQWFQLIGPAELVDLVLEHYSELTVDHRDNLPLRLVYAPDVHGGSTG